MASRPPTPPASVASLPTGLARSHYSSASASGAPPGGGDRPVVEFHSSQLFAADLASLAPGGWLTDAVLTWWWEVLSHDVLPPGPRRDAAAFVHPPAAFCARFLEGDDLAEVLAPLDLPRRELAFFPVSDADDPAEPAGGSHWSLLVWSKAGNSFHAYDSAPGGGAGNRAAAAQAAANLGPLLGAARNARGAPRPAPLTHEWCPPQANGSDCGVHVCAIAAAVAAAGGHAPRVAAGATPAAVAAYRARMAALASDHARITAGLRDIRAPGESALLAAAHARRSM